MTMPLTEKSATSRNPTSREAASAAKPAIVVIAPVARGRRIVRIDDRAPPSGCTMDR